MTAEDVLQRILSLYKIEEDTLISSRYSITYADILYGIILTSSIEEASELLGMTQKSLEYIYYILKYVKLYLRTPQLSGGIFY